MTASRFAEAAARQLRLTVDGVADIAIELGEARYPSGPATMAEHAKLLAQLLEQRQISRLGSGGLERIEQLATQAVEHGREDLGLTALIAPEEDRDTQQPTGAHTRRTR